VPYGELDSGDQRATIGDAVVNVQELDGGRG
jgi:hypothetical protein